MRWINFNVRPATAPIGVNRQGPLRCPLATFVAICNGSSTSRRDVQLLANVTHRVELMRSKFIQRRPLLALGAAGRMTPASLDLVGICVNRTDAVYSPNRSLVPACPRGAIVASGACAGAPGSRNRLTIG